MFQVAHNDKIVQMLRSFLGAEADLTSLAVFESISLNNLPLTKRGSLFHGGVVTPLTIREMAENVNNNGRFVPLHAMHQTSEDLPLGRVFHAEVQEATSGDNIVTNLHTLFYISTASEEGSDLVTKLNSGVIRELSVGFRAKQTLCSECGFDYMGPEADFMNWWDLSCNEGHEIGVDGVHVQLQGVDQFAELSLVNRGAAKNSQVLNRQQAVISKDEGLRSLAASSNISNDLAFIFASKGEETTMKIMTEKDRQDLLAALNTRASAAVEAKHQPTMDLLATIVEGMTYDQAAELKEKFNTTLSEFSADSKETPVVTKDDVKPEEALAASDADKTPSEETAAKTPQITSLTTEISLDAFVDLKADLKISDVKVTSLETELAALTASTVEKDATIVDLTAKTENMESLQADLKAATDFLKLACQNMLIASGVEKPVIPETITDLMETIRLAGKEVSKLPVGGISVAADAGASDDKNKGKSLSASNDAFKTRK